MIKVVTGLLLTIFMLCGVCFADTMEKVSDTKVSITKQVVIQVSLDQLTSQSALAQKQIDAITARKSGIDKQITDAKALGVKTSAELKAE